MWAKLSVTLLLIASSTGCLGLETGEEVVPLEPAASHDGNTSATQDDGQTTADGAGANETQEEPSTGEAGSSGDDPGSSEETVGSDADDEGDDDPEPIAWSREGSLALGWVAAVGGNFTGEVSQASGQGETDGDHCPRAHLIVPKGTGDLTLRVSGQPVEANASGDPANASAPGAGLYTVYIQTADGQEIYLDGPSATDAEGAELRHEAKDPAPGTWTIEMRPWGPVVQQTWEVQASLAGQTVVLPGPLAYVPTC